MGVFMKAKVLKYDDVKQQLNYYDFSKPGKLIKKSRSLFIKIWERFAFLSSSILSERLDTDVHIKFKNMKSCLFREFNNQGEKNTLVSVISTLPVEGYGALNIESVVNHSIIQTLLGRPASSYKSQSPGRSFTHIEQSITESVLVRFLGALHESLQCILNFKPKIEELYHKGSSSKFIQDNEPVIDCIFSINVAGDKGKFHLILPVLFFEKLNPVLSDSLKQTSVDASTLLVHKFNIECELNCWDKMTQEIVDMDYKVKKNYSVENVYKQ